MRHATPSIKERGNMFYSESLPRFGGIAKPICSRIATVALCLTLVTTILPAASGATIYQLSGRLAGKDSADDAFGSDAFGFDGKFFQAVIELHDDTPNMVRAVDVVFRSLEGTLTIGSESLELVNAEARFNTDHFLGEAPGGSFTFNTARGEFQLRFNAATAISYDPEFDVAKPVDLPTKGIELSSASMWGLPHVYCVTAPCPSSQRSSYAVLDSLVTVVPEPSSCGLAVLSITSVLFRRLIRY